jgi:hypothetical protein
MMATTCPTCGLASCINPQFCALCRKADAERAKTTDSADVLRNRRLLALSDHVSFETIWRELNTIKYRAAASTVEALMYALRRGGSALNESSNLRRLGELSEPQLHEVCARLQKFKPHIARAWTQREIEALVVPWTELKNG